MDLIPMIALFISITIMLSIGIVIIQQSQNCNLLPTTTNINYDHLTPLYTNTFDISGELRGVALEGDKVYGVDDVEGTDLTLFYYGIDPNGPNYKQKVIVDTFPNSANFNPFGMAIQSDYLFLDAGSIYMYDFNGNDITNPTPLEIATLNDFTVTDDTIYGSASIGILKAPIDLSARTMGSFVVVGTPSGIDISYGISKVGELLFIGDSDNNGIYNVPFDDTTNTFGTPVFLRTSTLDIGGSLTYFTYSDQILIVSATTEKVYEVYGTYSETSSWNSICLDNEQSARDSYALLLIITIVIAAIAVLTIIRRLG